MELEEKPKAGRPRGFDPDQALEAAMLAFWEHGYEATSLALLREATGLTPPQIYNAFTDKETLFRLALERYHRTQLGFAQSALDAPVPTRAAMALLLRGAADAYRDPAKPGGCLFVSGALATSPQAQPVADLLKAYRLGNEAAIAARLERGMADGDVPPDFDAARMARFIVSVMHGMAIQARDGASVDQLHELADTALAFWSD